jgi:hypothetical protein
MQFYLSPKNIRRKRNMKRVKVKLHKVKVKPGCKNQFHPKQHIAGIKATNPIIEIKPLA